MTSDLGNHRSLGLRWLIRAVHFAAVLGARSALPDEPVAERSATIETFGFISDDYPVVVPVTLAGKSHAFLVDTGAATTAYDESLRSHLGPRRETARIRAADHHVAADLFAAPDARVGRLSCMGELPVAAIDLRPMREAAKYDIMGILGMDFLRRIVWRLDFDAERIDFLASVPPGSGEPVSVLYDERLPYVLPKLAGWGSVRLLVDTGHSTDETGLVERHLFDALARRDLLRGYGEADQTDLVETRRKRNAIIPTMTLGPFNHDGLRFSPAQNMSVLGLRYWARYIVTFDLLNHKLYLKPSERFASGVPTDLSGIFFVRTDKKLFIRSVQHCCPGKSAGLKVGDRLVRVGDLDVGDARLQDVRARFCKSGNIAVVASRNGKEFTAHMSLLMPGGS